MKNLQGFYLKQLINNSLTLGKGNRNHDGVIGIYFLRCYSFLEKIHQKLETLFHPISSFVQQKCFATRRNFDSLLGLLDM